MVNSVSAVRFKGNDMLSRPGAFTKEPEEMAAKNNEQPAQKGSKTAKIVLGTAIGAVALLGGAAALKHFKPEVFKVLDADKLTNAKITEKMTHYIAKLGDFVIDKSTKFIDWGKNLFKRS